jgi:uncharacterized membrane protein
MHSDDHHGHSHAHGHSHGPKEEGKSALFYRLISIGIGIIILIATPFIINLVSDYSIVQIRELYATNNNIPDSEIVIGTVSRTQTINQTEAGDNLVTQIMVVRPESGGDEIRISANYFQENQVPTLRNGDRVFYQVQTIPESGEEVYQFVDVYRLNILFWLLAILVVVTLLMTGLKGVSAFIGLIFTTMVIFNYLLPEILSGSPIIFTTFAATLVITVISMYLSHGIRKPTSVAVLSALFTIFLTFVVSLIVENAMKYTGVSTHELAELQLLETLSEQNFNIRSLFLAGIVLGTLGVLDDVTIAQAYVVDELYKANKSFKPFEVFWSALRVGQEHIVSLINTLTLAYVATGIPLIIPFIIYGVGDVWVLLNSEIISGEIVRAILGSLTLFMAIPISTLFASFLLNEDFARRFKLKLTKKKTY